MSPELLDEFKALSPGCEVWFVSGPVSSKWARKIDWYLGFQMMKASTHDSRKLPDGLRNILISEELAEPPRPALGKSAPLMIASAHRLPVGKTVMIPFEGDVTDWSEKCHHIWRNLTCPRVRVFLPDTVSVKSFVAAWPRQSRDSARVEIVSESNID